MTQEDKELLLKDLRERLPYGVKISYVSLDGKICGEPITLTPIDYKFDIEEVKPYLRPMSSMTKEERKEYHSYCYYYCGNYFDTVRSIDWLNAHHFDYRGLIEKGLALEAPEGMYNIKEK